MASIWPRPIIERRADSHIAYVLAERDWLRDFTRWAKGDPSLSSWEARFINGMGYLAEGDDDDPLVSAKQWNVIGQLVAQLGYATNAPVRIPDDEEA